MMLLMDWGETKYAKALDKRKKLYGIKREGEKGWRMEPQFENLGMMDWYTSDTKDTDFVMRCCRCEKF